jgi:hypothetical protein
MCHISHQRMRRFLIFSALLFSLGLFANKGVIFHTAYAIRLMAYGGAAAQEMPKEKGDFREPDLVELAKLDSVARFTKRPARFCSAPPPKP